jgi:hypothetical protein
MITLGFKHASLALLADDRNLGCGACAERDTLIGLFSDVKARNGVIGADYPAKFIKAKTFRTSLLNDNFKGAPPCQKKITTRPL